MDKFRSRSSNDDREPGTRARRAPVTPGPGARRPGPPLRSPARIATRILLLLALATATLALTQCRMVGDRLTGVDAGLLRRKSDCLKACKETFQADRKAEVDLFAQRISACAGNTTCIAEELARHQAALQAIEAAYLACQNSCHDQGGGTVGP